MVILIKISFLKRQESIDDLLKEMRFFCQIHANEGTTLWGVHLELTGDNVTECVGVGGSRNLDDNDLQWYYQTNYDPRLNAEQAVELSFEIAELLNP